jgi:Heterodisulfide reductase, subunit C
MNIDQAINPFPRSFIKPCCSAFVFSTDELMVTFRLDDCIGCRACSKACPSCRNGGVDPEGIVSSIRSGNGVNDIWKCLQCHRCSMVCPKKIHVSALILELRNIDSKEGNIPETFRREAKALRADGFISIPKGRMALVRKDLGLKEIIKSDAVSELNEILDREGFPND